MRWLKKYHLFNESKTYSNKNLISEICISMTLLNNDFLSNILDRGLKARYSENSQIFLTDLKNLLISKNRLKLGKFVDKECVEDDEVSKINGLFDEVKFDIEKDWNVLVNARITARNIIDKLLPDQKLESDMISAIYWLGPNKDDEHQEDIVIELDGGKQYSFFLNKNLLSKKSASFNTFAENLLGQDLELLYKQEYLPKWDKLTQEWIRILYENANKNIQLHIEKFIDPKRIESIGYFEYFDIRHSDYKYKYLGEFIKDFDKNILKLSDLLTEVWKHRDNCFMDPERVYAEWMEAKIVILNSRILENLFTTSLKSNFANDIKKLEDGFKLAGGAVKMKLFKSFIDKLGCEERPLYFLGSNGNIFNLLPERDFFRTNYDDMNIKFDYHVNFAVSEQEESNDFKVKLILELDDKKLLDMTITIKFSHEMSGRLTASYKFNLSNNFNYMIATKKSNVELLKLYEYFNNSTFDARTRYSYTHPKTHRTLSFSHEYFTTRINGKIVSSCIITYPRLSPNKFTDDGRKAFSIYTGREELFDDKDGNFVKIYDVKSRKDGKGYGKLLFEKLKEYLKSKGKNRIYLDVDKENLGAHEFYKKIGFKNKYDGVSDIGYVLNF